MRVVRWLSAVIAFAVSLAMASGGPAIADSLDYSVGPQYVTTHVYVPAAVFDRFIASLTATFGGKTSTKGTLQVTPTTSKTMSQLALTPSGTISAFGYVTPVPFPFASEHYGYLVTNLEAATAAAQASGASLVVAPFNDPIGKDAVVAWPGGVVMQLYWHTTAPNYPKLAFEPEHRVYVAPDRADEFVRDFLSFSHGKVVSDNATAAGVEIGRPGDTYRRIRITSGYGKMQVIVTDGHLPFPFGHESTGYQVNDLDATLVKAKGAGAKALVPAFNSDGRRSALLEFPGGYVAEVHMVEK